MNAGPRFPSTILFFAFASLSCILCSTTSTSNNVNGPQNVDGACQRNCRPILQEICQKQQTFIRAPDTSAASCSCPMSEENALKIVDKNSKFLNLAIFNEISKRQRMDNPFGHFGGNFKFVGKIWNKGRKWWLKNGQKWSKNRQKILTKIRKNGTKIDEPNKIENDPQNNVEMESRCMKIEEHYFRQRVDHFSRESNEAERAKKTFAQLYQINWCMFDPTKWPSSSPAVLLLIGGESKLYSESIKGIHLPLMEMARDNGAVIVQLEHRFFGKKDENLGLYTVENLRRVLTVEQALADISAFIDHFNRKHLKDKKGRRVKPKWILIGISYSGVLAAWHRRQFPKMSAGAVAASAPIFPKMNFFEWSMTIERNIKSVDQNCFDVLKSIISEAFMKRRMRQGIEELFLHFGDYGMSLPETIFLIWSDITQKPCPDFGITYESACTILTDESMIREHRLVKLINEWAMTCGKMEKYKKALENAENNNIDKNEAARIFYPDVLETNGIDEYSARQSFQWLLCNQLGYFQTSDYSNGIFGPAIPLLFYSQGCTSYWSEIDSQYIEKQTLEMWKKYGDGCSYQASNILFVNGSFDPWTALSYQRECRNEKQIKMDEKNGMHSIIIKGEFHLDSFYFYRKNEGDVPAAGVEQARKETREKIKHYLANAR